MKIRRVDFYPDDWLAGTAGMPGREKSVYWDICALIYSRGGPIPDDEQWLSRVCGYHWRELRAIMASLIKSGKIVSKDGHVSVKRCSEELQRAFKRTAQNVHNGRKGGRPSRENNDMDKPNGSGGGKGNNQQSTTNNQQEERREAGLDSESPSEPSESPKTARAPSRYAYAGKVVRLTPMDYDRWHKRYHGIADLAAYLGTLDDFYATLPADEQKKWFVRCSAALEKKHEAEMQRRVPMTVNDPLPGI